MKLSRSYSFQKEFSHPRTFLISIITFSTFLISSTLASVSHGQTPESRAKEIESDLFKMEFIKAVKDKPEILANFTSSYLKNLKEHYKSSNASFNNWNPTSEIDDALKSEDLRKITRSLQGISVGVGAGISVSTDITVPLDGLIAIYGKSSAASKQVFVDYFLNNPELATSVAEQIYLISQKTGPLTAPETLSVKAYKTATEGTAICPPKKILSCSEYAPILLGLDDVKRKLIAKGDSIGLINNFYQTTRSTSGASVRDKFEKNVIDDISPVIISSSGVNITTTKGKIEEFIASQIQKDPSLKDRYKNIRNVEADIVKQYSGTSEFKLNMIKSNIYDARAYGSVAKNISSVIFPNNAELEQAFSLADTALSFAASAAEVYYSFNPAALASAVSSGISLVKGIFGSKKSPESGLSKAIGAILENQKKMLESLARIENQINVTQNKIDKLSSDTWVIYASLSTQFNNIDQSITLAMDNILEQLDYIQNLSNSSYELSKATLTKMSQDRYNDNLQNIKAFTQQIKTAKELDKQYNNRIPIASSFNTIAEAGYDWSASTPFANNNINNYVDFGGARRFEGEDSDIGILSNWNKFFPGSITKPANPSLIEKSLYDYFSYAYKLPEGYLSHENNWNLLMKRIKNNIENENIILNNTPAAYKKTIQDAIKLDRFFNVKLPNIIHENEQGYLNPPTVSLLNIVNPLPLQSNSLTSIKIQLSRNKNGLEIKPILKNNDVDSVFLERRQAYYLASEGLANDYWIISDMEIQKTIGEFIDNLFTVSVCFYATHRANLSEKIKTQYGIPIEEGDYIVLDSFKLCQKISEINAKYYLIYSLDKADSNGKILSKGDGTIRTFINGSADIIQESDKDKGQYIYNLLYGKGSPEVYNASALSKESWDDRQPIKTSIKVNKLFSKMASQYPNKALAVLRDASKSGRFATELQIMDIIDREIALLNVGFTTAFPNCELALKREVGIIYKKPLGNIFTVSGEYYPTIVDSKSTKEPRDYITYDEATYSSRPSLRQTFIYALNNNDAVAIYKLSLYFHQLAKRPVEWNDMKTESKISSSYCAKNSRMQYLYKMSDTIKKIYSDF